jgi:hypothetical protein
MIPPLDFLGAEGAALSNATTLLAFIAYITEKVKEVRAFRKECLDLTDTCINLSLAYLENEEQLKEARSGKDFKECLRSVYPFVMQCHEWNVLHTGWEVVVKQKLGALKKRLIEVQKTFNTELLVCLNLEGRNGPSLLTIQR